jgi:hypothetical protein
LAGTAMMPLLPSRILSCALLASFCSTIFWMAPRALRTMRP